MAQPILKFPDYWSEADLGDLPADGHRYEIVDGSLLVTPPPLDSHQAISGNLYFILRTAAPAGWRVLYEVGVRVPGGNFIPDLVVLKPDSARGVEWRESSDVALVIEIASRSTELVDRSLKVIKYAEAGIPNYWRIEGDGTVEVRALTDGQYVMKGTIAPGEPAHLAEPFSVEFDPANLTD
ncbi:hypothetical protein EB75_14730 [Mycobacterium sp. ST-F2]|nr:hypothetical protein EB75_14730 [Mycobacterium sp. ST-F2]